MITENWYRWDPLFRKYLGALSSFYRPKRSFGQGNIFTAVCHSFCSHGGRRVSDPNFRGGAVWSKFSGGGVCSNFSGRGQTAPNFRGGGMEGGLLQIFRGGGVCSNFSGGVVSAPNFRGGLLQFFGGGVCSNFRNTVNVRPVRILLECILVWPIFSQFSFTSWKSKSWGIFGCLNGSMKEVYQEIEISYFYRPKRSFGQGNILTSVCLSTGWGVSNFFGGVSPIFQGGLQFFGGSPIRSTFGQYASYWNGFLFNLKWKKEGSFSVQLD